MTEGGDLEALFLQHIGAIERIASSICRRHSLSREDTEDFTSSFNARLVESGYAVLAKFRGDSSLTTYLTVVIAMAFRDYRAERWGRWRPSAVARASGPIALRLETLVYRDGLSFDEAIETLRTTSANSPSPRELAEMLARFPRRAPLRPVEVGPESLAVTSAEYGADDLVSSRADDDERTAIEAALTRALGTLPAEERLMLRMRYWEKLSVADVARVLALPPKNHCIDESIALLAVYARNSKLLVSRESRHSRW